MRLLFSVFMVVFIAPFVLAQDLDTKVFKSAKQWTVYSYASEEGGFSHCALVREWTSGQYIIFAQTAYAYNFAFGSTKWKLTPDSVYEIELKADQFQRSANAVIDESGGLAIVEDVASDEDTVFFDSLEETKILVVTTSKSALEYDVKSFKKGRQMLNDCFEKYYDGSLEESPF